MSFQASKALMELRVSLCQTSAGSKGIRCVARPALPPSTHSCRRGARRDSAGSSGPQTTPRSRKPTPSSQSSCGKPRTRRPNSPPPTVQTAAEPSAPASPCPGRSATHPPLLATRVLARRVWRREVLYGGGQECDGVQLGSGAGDEGLGLWSRLALLGRSSHDLRDSHRSRGGRGCTRVASVMRPLTRDCCLFTSVRDDLTG